MKPSLALLAPPALVWAPVPVAHAQESQAEEDSATVGSGIQLRSIGPAFLSGRISEVVVDPIDQSVWCVAAASGGVRKTENAGTTRKPIFEGYGSYSIGTIAIHPNRVVEREGNRVRPPEQRAVRRG